MVTSALLAPSLRGRDLGNLGATAAPSRLAESVVGNHTFVQTQASQTTPPGQLGAGTVVDRQFASTIADNGPAPGSYRALPNQAPWKPLWQDPALIVGKKKQEFQWSFESPHSRLEDVSLHINYRARAGRGVAQTIPTEKPVPVTRLAELRLGEVRSRPLDAKPLAVGL
jgi:hypothetical protein